MPRHISPIPFALAATLAASPVVAQNTATATPIAPAAGASIERLDPAFDALVPRDAKVEQLAQGFDWTEGPVWRKSGGYPQILSWTE
jgi:CelD/BcsL family acetyltransferase involved in cellulose biosynthesis